MELPKEKIEISVTGEQTREIAATTIGRSKDKPAKRLHSWGLITLGISSEKMTKICYSRTQQKTNTKSF